MINLKVDNALKAWESINELFILQPNEHFEHNKLGELTNSWYLYDIFMEIEDPIMDPEFDYAKYFHYTQHKWSKLVGNYLNLDALDELRDYVRDREKELVKIRQYSVSANFDNAHSNGKGCITNCSINRTLISDKPEITIVMRAVEVTTRFAVDLNFIYRFGEYIFGHNNFVVKIFIKQAMALENLLVLYHNHKKLRTLNKKADSKVISQKLLDRLKDFMESSEEKYSGYAVFFRPYKVMRTDLYETPKPLLAGNLVIGDWTGIPLPRICPTLLERDRIKTIYDKMVNKYKMDFTKLGERRTVEGNNINLSGTPVTDDTDDNNEE